MDTLEPSHVREAELWAGGTLINFMPIRGFRMLILPRLVR